MQKACILPFPPRQTHFQPGEYCPKVDAETCGIGGAANVITIGIIWNAFVDVAKELGFGTTGADNFPQISFGNPVNNLRNVDILAAWHTSESGYHQPAACLVFLNSPIKTSNPLSPPPDAKLLVRLACSHVIVPGFRWSSALNVPLLFPAPDVGLKCSPAVTL